MSFVREPATHFSRVIEQNRAWPGPSDIQAEFFCTAPTDPMGATGEPGRLGDHSFTAQGCAGDLVCTPVELDPAENYCDRNTEQLRRALLADPPRGFEHIGACAVPPSADRRHETPSNAQIDLQDQSVEPFARPPFAGTHGTAHGPDTLCKF